jgi:hypothetical protein
VQRLRSDFWVSAYIRHCMTEGAFATLRKRGAEEAGAIWILVERANRDVALYGPAPQSEMGDVDADRIFAPVFVDIWVQREQAEAKIARENTFDPDLFVIETEDKDGRFFANIVKRDRTNAESEKDPSR